uniref:Uncharacterized protein n=1 Tax=Anopheles coluzzii TaxID=1518534 RepID=A0A8W7PW38_ANOCL
MNLKPFCRLLLPSWGGPSKLFARGLLSPNASVPFVPLCDLSSCDSADAIWSAASVISMRNISPCPSWLRSPRLHRMHCLPGYFSGKYGISSGAGMSRAGSASISPVGVDATELLAVLAAPPPSSLGEASSEPPNPAVGEASGTGAPDDGLRAPGVMELEGMVVVVVVVLSLIIVVLLLLLPKPPAGPLPAGFVPPPDDIFSSGMKSFFGRPGPRRRAAADGLPPPRPNRTTGGCAAAGDDTDDGEDDAGDDAFEEEADEPVPLLSVTLARVAGWDGGGGGGR